MEPLLCGSDYSDALAQFKERLGLHGRNVVVKRFTSFSGGTGETAPNRNTTNVTVKAIINAVTPAAQNQSGGFVMVGDIRTTTLIDVVEDKEGIGTSSTQADFLTYEGNNWRLIGKPTRNFHGGGRVSTDAYWRRV